MSALQTSLPVIRPAVRSRPFRRKPRHAAAASAHSLPSKSVRPGATLPLRAAESDWLLVQQAMAGDSPARERIFASHVTMLRRIAFNILRNKEDAEDAVQDGLCKAFVRLQSFQGRSAFSTWLTRIIINSALMIRRTGIRHPEPSLDEILECQPERLQQGIVDARPNPEEICATTEIQRLTEKQVLQLPQGLRAAFQLRGMEGMSAADSIQALGIHKSAFKSRMLRARRKIAEGLRHSLQCPVGDLPAA